MIHSPLVGAMENIAIVQSGLAAGEKCNIALEAGLVHDWVKTTRLLALVERQGEHGLFIYSSSCSPITCSADLQLEKVLPINTDFRCEIDSAVSNVNATDVYVKLSSQKLKFLFEMPFGPKTNHFTTEISKATEVFSRRTGRADFIWLQKYECNHVATNPFAADVFDPYKSGHVVRPETLGFEDDFTDGVTLRRPQQTASNIQSPVNEDANTPADLESPDSFKHLPRQSIAIGATPLAARDSVIRLQMTMREDDYTNVQTFSVFVGTWNVNGQPPNEPLTGWLHVDPVPPDMYAVGFQELDLSKEAFLFYDSPREEEWLNAVLLALHPDAKYCRVKLVRLVGMMLIIFIQEKHLSAVQNVVAETVGTGIMGKMGNKGGVAVRFDLHNTSVCFVNSHLAAHTEGYERRNQDYNDICARMNFTQFIPPKSIKDHDQIFWLGDLNYRICSMNADQVKKFIELNEFGLLMEHDQLKQQHKLKRVFVGYKEGDVKFNPTYKYDPGTDNWDTSDKCRTPAWCDRILWKGNNIKQLVYRSHFTMRTSDHKPVSSIFEAGVKVIDTVKHRKIFEEVMKKLDKLENEFLPQVAVDNTEIHYDNVRFVDSQVRYLTIANVGQVPVQFEFIKKLNDTTYCKDWLKIKPYSSFIMPGEKCDLELEVYVDKHTVHKLNSGEDKIYDILVLHLEGGKDIFITVAGTYEPSCFGMPLECLVHVHGPIREIPVAKLIDLEASPQKDNKNKKDPYDIPKEIWLLVDHLYKYALDKEHLFEQPGLHSEIQQIRECLDTGVPDKLPGSSYSVAEALLIFLEALPEPVIPFNFHNKSLESANNFATCKTILALVPHVHRNVFKYLMSFLRELLSHSEKNKLDIKMLTTMFGSILIRPRPPEHYDESTAKRSTNQSAIDKKKATFVYHFLVNDLDV